MFILDSLLVSGLRWVLDTVKTAAEAEMDDDAALRDQLMDAEMRRELGELSDDEFAAIEADLLARIREIKARRGGGAGPIAFGAAETAGETLTVDATISGDFHEPASAPSDEAALRKAAGASAPRRAAAPARRKIRKS